MREFPKNAVMERRMSTATKQIDSCCWSPPTKEGEHSSSSYDFVWLLPLLKFVVNIILSSAFPFLVGFCSCNEKWQQGFHKPKFPTNNPERLTYLIHIRKFSARSKKYFFSQEPLGSSEKAIKGKYRHIRMYQLYLSLSYNNIHESIIYVKRL